MKLLSVNAGFFKLDGGAMFGVVPRTIWEKLNPPDEKNLCTWAMRCLLIEIQDRRILIDTGIGTKQSEKFFSYYEPNGGPIEKALQDQGIEPETITDVILTHLHFDHCGGAITKDKEGNLSPTFPNATYWSNHRHWDWAMRPNPRERASFLRENFEPLEKWGKVKWLYDGDELIPGIKVHFVYGHTEAMMLVRISLKKGRDLIYMADLIPSAAHVPLPYVMSYDVRPLQTLQERERFLKEAVENSNILFFEHDPVNECAIVEEGKRYPVISRLLTLEEAVDG